MGYFLNEHGGRILKQIVATALILLFSYASLSKLGDLNTFELQMFNQPLPRLINQALVWLVPSAEIIVVFLLVFKSTQRLGFIGSALLMSVFTIYVGAMVFHFFDRVPCSCGGVLRSMSWERHLVFNIFFTTLAFVGVVVSKKPKA
jgi:hypothetical protein